MPGPMTEAEREAFLAEPRVAVLSVAEGNGRPPHATPVWYAYEPGGNVSFFSAGRVGGGEGTGEVHLSPTSEAFVARAAARQRALVTAWEASARDPYWAGLRPSMMGVRQGGEFLDDRGSGRGRHAGRSHPRRAGAVWGRGQPLPGRASAAPGQRAQRCGEHGAVRDPGDARGRGRLLLPELAEEIAAPERFTRALSPRDVRGVVDLPGRVVIALGCETGTPELARAFLDGGCAAYVAPEGAPFGYASVFVPVFLFYELTEMRSLEAAVERLRRHDPELGMWRLFR